MGERGDIIKAMQRAMNDSGDPCLMTSARLFDPGNPSAKSVTDKIIARGVADDVRDQAYVVIDATDGKLADASRTSGEFIKAHVRRLEAMRKAGAPVARQADGPWAHTAGFSRRGTIRGLRISWMLGKQRNTGGR